MCGVRNSMRSDQRDQKRHQASGAVPPAKVEGLSASETGDSDAKTLWATVLDIPRGLALLGITLACALVGWVLLSHNSPRLTVPLIVVGLSPVLLWLTRRQPEFVVASMIAAQGLDGFQLQTPVATISARTTL